MLLPLMLLPLLLPLLASLLPLPTSLLPHRHCCRHGCRQRRSPLHRDHCRGQCVLLPFTHGSMLHQTDGCNSVDCRMDFKGQMEEMHKHRWCAGIDVLGHYNALQNNTGQAAVPYVVSSALAVGKGTFVPAALFEGEERGCYDPPQVLCDTIIAKRNDGSAILNYFHHESAFPDGMQEKVFAMVLQLFQDLSECMQI